MKTIGHLLVCCILLAGTLLPVPASASGEQMSAVDKSSDMDSAVALASMESPLLHRLTREAGKKKKGKGKNKSKKSKQAKKKKKNKRKNKTKKGKGRKRVKSSKKKKDKKKNGRNKKGKKNKKKGKTGKKGRNSKGKKKNKKKNKNKDKNKSEGRSTNENRQDPCPICVEKLRDLALVFGNQARNVYRQARRSLADIDMIAKKKAKSGDFTLHLSQLLKHLNQTLPMQNPPVPPVDCDFTGTNFTITTLVDDTNLLASCQSNIDIECAPTTIDQDRLRACEASANDYRTLFTGEFKGKSYEEICVGVSGVNSPALLRLEQEVKDCVDFTKTSVATLDSQLRKCKKAFSNCRKAERNIIDYMYHCKGPGGSCGDDDGTTTVPPSNTDTTVTADPNSSTTTADPTTVTAPATTTAGSTTGAATTTTPPPTTATTTAAATTTVNTTPTIATTTTAAATTTTVVTTTTPTTTTTTISTTTTV